MPEHDSKSPGQQPAASAASNAAIPGQEVVKQEVYMEGLDRIPLQRKLTVGAVDDPLEHEADSMADKVMRMPEPNLIQRKCAHCEEEERVQRKPLAPFIQRKGSEGGLVTSDSVSNQINATRGNGSAMDTPTRSFMETRFGADFSNVKIHTNTDAVQMSRQLNAKAFTVGNDIYFNTGQYNPGSDSGRHLLAHELTHTVQQSSGVVARKIQRTVDKVDINCADNEIRFDHDNTTTTYGLDSCHITEGTYDADVKLSPGRVDFTLGTLPEGGLFDFSYKVGPGQPGPETFFKGQSKVLINCTNVSRLLSEPGNIQFNVKELTPAQFYEMTGNSVDTIPEGKMVPLGNFLNRSLPVATAGASYFSPTPWSFIPKDVTGVLWTPGHTSVFSNPSGAFSPTIKGYRGNLGWYVGESYAPNAWVRQQCTIRLNEGVPGSFANDAWFPMFPGDQYYVFMPRTNEQASAFADKLANTEYGGQYTYSPPRTEADPFLGDVSPGESGLHATLTERGKAPMCTNNCITVPKEEIIGAMGGKPTTPKGVDVMTGTGPDGTVDPHHAGRGRLMTEAMSEGPIPAGASRMKITVTPGGSAGMFVVRGAGRIMLVYGIYQTGSRILNTKPGDLPVVLSEEAGTWTGGILGSALGAAIGSAVFCAPLGPVDAVCVVGGFAVGLLYGIAGSEVGQAIGHTVGEYVVQPVVNTVDKYVVEPVVNKVNETEAEWTQGIYNLYGVPRL